MSKKYCGLILKTYYDKMGDTSKIEVFGKSMLEWVSLALTDAETELLESKRRGHALFVIGSKRLHINFEIPSYKFSYMGTAGGR